MYSYVMIQRYFVLLWRFTHFSKTAQPNTVPNTDTGKIYLLMTDDKNNYNTFFPECIC